jgi:hypothetical protein
MTEFTQDTVPTKYAEADGIRFAYRRLSPLPLSPRAAPRPWPARRGRSPPTPAGLTPRRDGSLPRPGAWRLTTGPAAGGPTPAGRVPPGQRLQPPLGAKPGHHAGIEHVGQLEVPDAGGGVAEGLDGDRVQLGSDRGVQDPAHGRSAADGVGIGQHGGAARLAQRVGPVRGEPDHGGGEGGGGLARPAAVGRRVQKRPARRSSPSRRDRSARPMSACSRGRPPAGAHVGRLGELLKEKTAVLVVGEQRQDGAVRVAGVHLAEFVGQGRRPKQVPALARG